MPTYLRVTPGGRDREFAHAVHRKVGWKSGPLKRVVSVVDQYIRTPNSNNLRCVVNAFANWKIRMPVEFRRRCATIWPTIHAQMRAEAAGYNNEFIECLDTIHNPPTRQQALNWVNAVANTAQGLIQFNTYACLDAVSFFRCINGDQTPTGPVRTRATNWNAGNHQPFGTMNSMLTRPTNRSWNPVRLRLTYDRIRNPGGRGAICTTFGYLAAHVLTDNRPNGPRVEIVSYPGGMGAHVYVLVGRKGGLTDQGRIPNNWNAVIVDAWAASLGHRCIYPNKDAFAFPSMIQNLELVMQRPAS